MRAAGQGHSLGRRIRSRIEGDQSQVAVVVTEEAGRIGLPAQATGDDHIAVEAGVEIVWVGLRRA